MRITSVETGDATLILFSAFQHLACEAEALNEDYLDLMRQRIILSS
jgi:hypothetical protein